MQGHHPCTLQSFGQGVFEAQVEVHDRAVVSNGCPKDRFHHATSVTYDFTRGRRLGGTQQGVEFLISGLVAFGHPCADMTGHLQG